ncbi:hypothetical protein [Campylobacter sp. 2014D-0216]|uniref:hypothetical protein n=1 Tax=Campylobacter sp. 2014D-0216 TaxID=1813595 RepID=UPI0018A648F3|nr:hypothetical protein [Campylobacter sp. 2014D-0216]QOR01087.1 hypothetical protein A0083_07555 [Campylobacter sp. 2014D-0216]
MQENESYFDKFDIIKAELIDSLGVKNICYNFYLECVEISNEIMHSFDFQLFQLYKLSFINCVFDCFVYNSENIILDIQNDIFIHKCIFKKDININDAIFRKKLDITSCVFKAKCRFNKNIFFGSCNFKDNLFNNAQFEKNQFLNDVMFYNSDFNMFNFSQSVFKGSLNVVNTNLNFTFDDLQEKIKQEYENFNKDKNEQYQKSLDKFANDFRDSFRVFKNALIKDNNLLEASNFHKYELYCKEIELNSNDVLSKYERDEVFDKLSLRLKQKVDWCLLLFYRKLSDHHTDLLKVINNCFILIAIYFICIFNFTNIDFLGIEEINIFSFLKSFSFYGDDKIVAAAKVSPLSCLLLLFFAPIAIFIASLYYSDKQKRSVVFKKIKFKIGRFLSVVSIFAAICFMLFVINSNFFIPLTKIVVFLSIFFLVIYIDSLYLRYYCAILSYINFILVIVYCPIILNPLIGKILNDKIKIEDPLAMVMTFTYTILMFLVLFSLQKTARKNSIVPS